MDGIHEATGSTPVGSTIHFYSEMNGRPVKEFFLLRAYPKINEHIKSHRPQRSSVAHRKL
jgi:hypothetical protein